MKLVDRETLRHMPPGTCFFPVRTDGAPIWDEWNIISNQDADGFTGIKPVVPYYERYSLMSNGHTEADNDTMDTTYWDYEVTQKFAVMSLEELKNVREAIDYALDCEGGE